MHDELEQVKKRLEAIEEQMQRVVAAVVDDPQYGRTGLASRVSKLEEQQSTHNQKFWFLGGVATVAVALFDTVKDKLFS